MFLWSHLNFRFRGCFVQWVLDIEAIIDCGLTLSRIRDMIIKYTQIHRTGKYSQHNSIIWTVFPNSLVVLFELGGVVLESGCSNLNFRYRACFYKGVLHIQETIECGFTLKSVRDITIKHSQMHRTGKYL